MESRGKRSRTAQVAEKVLRRAEIAKVARNLQDSLALASFKAQNGWQNRTLRAIEPEVTEHLKRKRPYSSDDILSDSSSYKSGSEELGSSPPLASISTNIRPATAYSAHTHFKAPPTFSDVRNVHAQKRLRSNSMVTTLSTQSSARNRQKTREIRSSPTRRRAQHSVTFADQSFVSDSATIPDSVSEHSPLFDIHPASDNEESDMPLHSFNNPISSSIISSSPPRTPPPDQHVRNGASKRTGADLLLYLANSPSRSPAATNSCPVPQHPPSTPPSQQTHLPSSVMNTPGAHMSLFNGALNTPGQGFNFADFVNVTPSPAQVAWGGRTPKTPAATRVARRSLNFDTLMPPGGHSQNVHRKTPVSQGLALELGEELMPRS